MSKIEKLKGSQRALIETVNCSSCRQSLEEKLRDAFPKWKDCSFIWLSPVKEDGYKEYTGKRFWDLIFSLSDTTPLKETRSFWPLRGCHWDGIIEVLNGSVRVGIILLEAKAHTSELFSSISARSESSIRIILDTLEKVKGKLRAVNESDWTGLYYQTANRIAHIMYLNSQESLRPVEFALANIYFLNDRFAIEECSERLSDQSDWMPHLNKEYKYLGINPEEHPILREQIKSIFISSPQY
jgi:hypothetical protein